MRNKIPCTAQKLSQLEPDMIQSVVDISIFEFGHHYHAENRVRIFEANDDHISSTVLGNTDLHKQTIQLKGGTLATRCSCPLDEQPFCRHCAAVLLAYHQLTQGRKQHSSLRDQPLGEFIAEQDSTASGLGLKLREITIFIDWLQLGVKALESERTLPDPPGLGPGEVMDWVQTIQKLEARWRWSEEKRLALEADLNAREEQFARLTQQLEASIQEAKVAQAAYEGMQRELASCQGMLSKLSEMTKERDRMEDQLKGFAAHLNSKGSEIESLATSLHEVSAALKALVNPSS